MIHGSYKILLGGDQLIITVARVRGAQALRMSQDKAKDRLEGVVPVDEDWHARMTLMKVSKNVSRTRIVYIVLLFIYNLYRLYGNGFIL